MHPPGRSSTAPSNYIRVPEKVLTATAGKACIKQYLQVMEPFKVHGSSPAGLQSCQAVLLHDQGTRHQQSLLSRRPPMAAKLAQQELINGRFSC